MAIPEFLADLRAVWGTRPLWLSAVTAVVIDDEDRLLLGRRKDTGRWSLIGGILDPGEEPAVGAVRECLEETGVTVLPLDLTSVTVSPPRVYPNGDRTQYLDLAFRCRPVAGDARVNDDESLEVAWFPLGALPELGQYDAFRLELALRFDGRTHFALSQVEPAES